ncbi:hypothetical protein KO02_05265 [Sphingobacterium sp. ML3W]|nr:hypothetical protein KO02_05265 [Sphingobacterium sp. ML3W]
MEKKFLLFPLLFSTLLFSCKEEFDSNDSLDLKNNQATRNYYNEFAIILSKAVQDNANVRTFIKQNALLEIDHDHDVFYQFVKEEKLSNGSSFKDILKKYEDYPNQLMEIENGAPLLTIFIPTIEPSKFSPAKWESNSVVPFIATNIMDSDKMIPIYENGEKILSLKSNEIPGFPVLVVKANERIKVKANQNIKASNSLTSSAFEFVSPQFDNSNKTKKNLANNKLKAGNLANSSGVVLGDPLPIDPSVINAYNIFGKDVSKWQRDHVYYKLSPTDTTGPLQTNMTESIVSLSITEDAYLKISDQAEDPKRTPNPNQIINLPDDYNRSTIMDLIQKNMWTDGKYEFRFDFLINNKQGIGATYQYFLPLSPSDFFYIPTSYSTRTTNGKNPQLLVVYSTTQLYRSRPKTVNLNIPIINWDIKSNAPIWKISLSEIDTQEEIYERETVTNEFATNFGLNIKIGFNFGMTNKDTFTREISTRRTLGEDNLGSVLVNFGDPIIDRYDARGGIYYLTTYSNSYFSIQLMPVKKF